jgi:DNA repair photolyase
LWSIEPYNRCSFRCTYCCSDAQGKSLPAISKENIVDVLEAELAAASSTGLFAPESTEIILSCYCDPYVPEEENMGITREIISCLSRKNLRFTLVTRSNLIERDIDILAPIKEQASVSMSIPILHPDYLELYENCTPLPAKRINAIHALSKAGIKTTVRIDPWIPGVTQVEEILKLLPATSDVLVSPLHLHQTLSAFLQQDIFDAQTAASSSLANKIIDVVRHGASRSTRKLFADLTQEQINLAYIHERNKIGFRKKTRWLYPVTEKSPIGDFYRFLKPDEIQS